jgi:glycosyltransferase involved in cell wall biosynthesis
MNYLLVTHIPFAHDDHGNAVVDSLWARDLIGLANTMGPIRVAAPQLANASDLRAWGPAVATLPATSGISFRGFPPVHSAREPWKWWRIRSVLREEVENADLIHTSNGFPPYAGLAYAHDLAVRLKKKTVFVIAEDFHDMLSWEWIRPAHGFQRMRRQFALRALDRRTQLSAGTASLTLMHTPASVARYRHHAANSLAIRQPGHEAEQVIPEQALAHRLSSLHQGRPLRIVTACRHADLKGLDLLIRAIALTKRRGIHLRAQLVGQGPQTEQLRNLASDLGVRSEIEFPGSLPAGPELDAALRSADLFLMPHRTTDFGRAFFDAMASGLPVVAFRTPASIDTVYENTDGLLTPLDDVQGLAEAIARLHYDRDQLASLSRGARRRALDNTRSEWFRLRAEWTQSLFAPTRSIRATRQEDERKEVHIAVA